MITPEKDWSAGRSERDLLRMVAERHTASWANANLEPTTWRW
jgi:hypothetical protein